MPTKPAVKRLSLEEAALLPIVPPIVREPMTSELREPYCVFSMDDNGEVSAIMFDMKTYKLTRTYWPGHADSRWVPERVATTAQQARAMLALRPQALVAIPESVVQEMYRGWTFALTSPQPE